MIEFRIGLGSCGVASGAGPVRDALEQAVREAGARARVKAVGCNGMCYREPLVEVVAPQGRITYANVTAETARRIVRDHTRRLNATHVDPPSTRLNRIVLENCGEIDPQSIDDYLARGGYRALQTCRAEPHPG